MNISPPRQSLKNSTVVPLHPGKTLYQADNALCQKFVRYQDRPLAIQLDARRIIRLMEHTEDIGAQLQLELELWRQVLGQREISSLELQYFDKHLEPYEITSLIHRIASQFKINKPLYRAVMTPAEAEPEVLALLKGLSFDHCQFAMEHAQAEEALDILEKPFSDARSFQFSKVGVQILHSEGVENLTQSIKTLRKTLAPDYIYIGCSTNRLTAEDIETNQTLFEDDLRTRRTDFLSLGPEATSVIGNNTIDAISDAKRYADAVNTGKLPITPTSI